MKKALLILLALVVSGASLLVVTQEATAQTEPSTALPLPTEDAENVISLFSGAYEDVPVDTWRTDWSQADLEDVNIDGSDMKKYSNLDFVGIETVSNQINATEMEYFNLDVWTPNMEVFRVKLVDFGPNGEFGGDDDTEHEIVFDNLVQGEWNSLQIPMSDFEGLVNRNNIAQLIFSGTPVGAGTVFVDNIYFSTDGEDPVDPPIGENLIINGSFDDGLDNWTPFIADFAGVGADVAVVDGEAAITNISGAGGEVWHVQLNQIFTQEQIDALEVGETYTAKFDARSNVDGRELRLFFGEDGGGFAAVNITDFNLTTSMETYEATFEVDATYGAMKFGFEMGLSNDNVYIDNVSLDLASGEPVISEMVTFQVDMTAQESAGNFDTSLGDEVYVRGSFNDWSAVDGDAMVGENGVYSFTYELFGDAGTVAEYKYYILAGDGRELPNTGWESDDVGMGGTNNRQVELIGVDQTLDVVFFNNDAPDPVEDNLILNGSFDDGLDNWTPFIADFAGVSADVAVVDGEAAITNINGAGGEVWHVQLNQILSSEQIGELEVGATYKAQFDARSVVDGRQLRLYFGQDGGGFVPVNITDFEINTEMGTYEAEFVINETFDTMKFGFEMGLSNDDVFIDNVSLVKTEDAGEPLPPMPQGFIVSNMVGENPVEPGQLFVAAGPNQVVEDGNLEYRLFYSPTNNQPEDPKDGTEHEFGTTAGDGGGVDAFGFVVSDLMEGTSYTFSLYQYNTANGLYSDPAQASAISGGEGDGALLTLPLTFEEDYGWNQIFVNTGGAVTTVIDNPDPSGINTSDRVARMVKGQGQQTDGSSITLDQSLDISTPINIKIWAPRENTTLMIKVENTEDPGQFHEVVRTIPASGEWTELSFDMSAGPDVNLDKMTFIFDRGTVGDGSADFTWYFDDIEYDDPTSIDDPITDLPAEFSLQQNYPNPFNPTTQIRYELPESAQVKLEVYNLMGQRVATLVNENMSAGTHSATFDGASLASGMYLYRLQAGTTVLTRKMMLVK